MSLGAALEGRSERYEIRRAVMVDVVRADHRACELLQEVAFFVGGPVGTDHTDGLRAPGVAKLPQLFAREAQGFFPRDRLMGAIGLLEQRLGEALRLIREVECVAALVAKEVAVHAGLVAVVAAHDFRAFRGGAYAERRLAAIAAVRADRGDVVHFPRPRLIPVGP